MTALALPSGKILLASPAAILVSDSFNRADNASVLGTAETGQAWTVLDGTFGIAGNAAYAPAGGASHIESRRADVVLRSPIRPGASHDVGLTLRSIDTNNYLLVQMSGGALNLFKQVTGSFTQLATVASVISDGGTYDLLVRVKGDAIQVWLNGASVIAYKLTAGELATFSSVQTKHGMRIVSAAARVDDFLVKAAV